MMKKALITFVALMLPMMASAINRLYNTQIGDFYYRFDYINKTASVSCASYENDFYQEGEQYEDWPSLWYNIISPYSGSVVIPPEVTFINVTYKVTSIGDYAFYNCNGLTSITIPSSVTTISDNAFEGCSSLTSITIPNSVTSIGGAAFRGCSNLTSITIPNSVTSIGSSAFSGTAWYDNQPDGLVYAGKVAYKYKGEMPASTHITIKDGTLRIESFAFENYSNLTSITIPNSVTSIGGSAFKDCSGLTSITIPSGVTSIGGSTFSGCSGLTSIAIPNGVISIGYQAFSDCSGLTSITIPSGVTSIGGSAFSGCSGLTSITIPSGVKSIGGSAFSGCSGLTSITIPSSVTNMGYSIFEYCNSLTSIIVEIGNTNYDSRDNCNAIIASKSNTLIHGCKNTVIPDEVTSIGDYAFYNCNGLTSITIPSGVTSIGDSAFSGCSGLTSITISSGVKFIGRSAFSGCSGLTSITIPSSVLNIENSIFQGCNSLTSIIVEIGNTNYDSRYNCNAIIATKNNTLIHGCMSTVIPDEVTSIGNYAFSGCSGLTSITIPSGVTSIGGSAFSDCSGLVSVTIGSGVTSIDVSAFSGCSNLTDVYCYAESVPKIPIAPIFSNIGNVTLYVPESLIGTYQNQTPWKNFKEIVALTENQQKETCATPTISFVNGDFVFSCETEGVTFNYQISQASSNNLSGQAERVKMNPSAITISAYATKTGYYRSETATATFTGKFGDLNGDGNVDVGDHVELTNIIMAQ